jgi:hypothetical protein
LYGYLIGKHNHKLVRKSVPYTRSLLVELEPVRWIAYIKRVPLEGRTRHHLALPPSSMVHAVRIDKENQKITLLIARVIV